jgi:predicted PurR-regulated permease PerM
VRAERPSSRATLLAVAASLVVLYLAVRYLFPFVAAVVIGGVLYYLFAPAVETLERRGVPRLVSALGALAAVLAVLVLLGLTLLPRLYEELEQLAVDLPGHVDRLESWLVGRGLLGEEVGVRGWADELVERAEGAEVNVLNVALGTLAGTIQSLFVLVFGLVIGFYLLVGGPTVARSVPGWLPPGQRDRWIRFGRDASIVLSGYLRARLIASAFIGVSYGLAFWAIGLPEPLLLGSIGGVLNLVPIVGPNLAAVPAVLVAAFDGWTTVILVLAVMVIAQQIESNFVAPPLEGRYVRLHPTVVVLVVAAGLAIGGIPGILLAVPVAGVARAALDAFYREGWDDVVVPAAGPPPDDAAIVGVDPAERRRRVPR